MTEAVHAIEKTPPPTDGDVFLWDSIEKEWRIAHWHAANDDTQGWCPMSARDLDTAREDIDPGHFDLLVPTMTKPTYWAPMFANPEDIK